VGPPKKEDGFPKKISRGKKEAEIHPTQTSVKQRKKEEERRVLGAGRERATGVRGVSEQKPEKNPGLGKKDTAGPKKGPRRGIDHRGGM